MESPEPVRRFKKKEGETFSLVEFWTCSRVEVRQYSSVLALLALYFRQLIRPTFRFANMRR